MKYNTATTLNEIREEGPCVDGWEELLAHLGKTKADDEPLELLTILESNGLDYAIWCLQVKSLNRLSRHFEAWSAEQLLHHSENERPGDARIRDLIAMLRNDCATEKERDAAIDAAIVALFVAARDAAKTAIWYAVRVDQEKQLRKMIGGEA
jgi:hypothetical protein